VKVLLKQPGTRTLILITGAALIATPLIWFGFAGPEQIMQSRGHGIVAYELAFSATQAEAILAAWGVEGQSAARASLLMDFAFMPSYALLFAGITLLIARGLQGTVGRIGSWLACGSIAAALFDALENVMLLSILNSANPVPALQPFAAGVSASIKFFLLSLAVIYWLVGGLTLLARAIVKR